MVLRAGLEPARIAPHAPQTCAATNYATSAVKESSKLQVQSSKSKTKDQDQRPINYLFAGGSPGASVLAGASSAGAVFAFASAGAAVLALASAVFASVEAGASAGVSGLVLKTETFPVSAGIASNNADNINSVAAPIVTFDKTVAVPRGLSAELETLLVNSAPASVLPGCSKTAATSTRQERKNNPYKK